MSHTRWAVALAVVSAVSGCKCGPQVSRVNPSLKLTPASVSFGVVKNGTQATSTIELESFTRAPVEISSIRLEPHDSVAGASAFSLGNKPERIEALGKTSLDITFSPTGTAAYGAKLVIDSNDADAPTQTIVIEGEGGDPKIKVTPDCNPSRKCVGTVVVTPPSIEFAPEPFVRLLPVDASTLPQADITNESVVELKILKLSIEGADAAAFLLKGNTAIPTGGYRLAAAAGFNVPIQFKPTSEQQQSYSASLVIESDDPVTPKVTVALKGNLRPNLPPVVCANVTSVRPADNAPLDYSSKAEWMKLLTPPSTGYDFTATRDIEPRALVNVSAISDSAVMTACTADPEDGRIMLTYQWRFLSTPPGAQMLGISGATTPTASFTPLVTGEYVMELSVKDVQGHETKVELKLAVAVKNDLVAQLQWTGFSDIDLDVHLVRPSAVPDGGSSNPFEGVFQYFEAGPNNQTSGDINGFSRIRQMQAPTTSNFNWGLAGTTDDPRLNIDDTGSGTLLENVSLNRPENDARCATQDCSYKVLVHYFKDARAPMMPASCTVDGGSNCRDGLSCSCATGQRCVADGAPTNDAGHGNGRCFAAPKPVVRIFLKGSATAAQVIPLDSLMPADELAIGAPCQMLYVADVVWPAKSKLNSLPDGGTPLATIDVKGASDGGRIASPVVSRFGWRQSGGSLQCSPDTTRGSAVPWYSETPN